MTRHNFFLKQNTNKSKYDIDINFLTTGSMKRKHITTSREQKKKPTNCSNFYPPWFRGYKARFSSWIASHPQNQQFWRRVRNEKALWALHLRGHEQSLSASKVGQEPHTYLHIEHIPYMEIHICLSGLAKQSLELKRYAAKRLLP